MSRINIPLGFAHNIVIANKYAISEEDTACQDNQREAINLGRRIGKTPERD
jgi:hypothetical protein